MRRSPIVFLDSGLLSELQSGDSLYTPKSFLEDFIGTSLTGYTSVVSGGGSVASKNISSLGGTYGLLTQRTGALATGSVLTHAGQIQTRIGGNYLLGFGTRIYLPVLSNATTRFTIRSGLGGSVATIGDQTGIYFRYNDSVAGGVFQGVSRNGVTESVVNSVIVPVVNSIYNLYFLVNKLGTSVEFFINNTSIGIVSTNLPLTTTSLGIFCSIQKSLGAGLIDFNTDSWFLENLQ